jgi:hypothetical protein
MNATARETVFVFLTREAEMLEGIRQFVNVLR